MAREYKLQRKKPVSASGIAYEKELNPEQFGAVTSPPGKSLVIAGAGSGKTRTLTYRVSWLLDQGEKARNILLLTFTNKAAREMVERVRSLVPGDVSDLWAGTFHSICNRILRRHSDEIGFTKSFSILDRDDQKSLMSGVVASCNIDTKQRRFPKSDVLISMFSLMVNTGVDLEEVLRARYPYFDDWAEELEKVRAGYVKKKRDTNSLDFDDMLCLTVDLFKEHPKVLKIYQKRFSHILVDEYQDTNSVQSELIDLLSGEANSLMAVGDDSQSIYSWRGAEVDHILNFRERYPDSVVHTIETNYRSVPEILDLSNAAISANKMRFEKSLRSSRAEVGAKPALVALEDPATQASFVAQRMLELRDEEGIELQEMAVLYRAHFQSLDIQMELTRRGIPFGITSGLRFFEQAHIKDVAAFLRFVTNRKDEVSFKRMVQMMPGCGPGTSEKLWQKWLSEPASGNPEPPDKWSAIFIEYSVPKKAAKHWEQFCYTMDELNPGGVFVSPSEMIFSVLEGIYDDYLKDSFENYESRRADIEQLIQYGGTFEDVLEFLAQLSLMSTTDGEPTGDKAELDDDKVTLSSIHQAKGLEWKVVFLIWLVDGQFPNGRILEADDEAAFEEERRLFYVALTRAKDELYLTYPMLNPKSYTGDVLCRPSRFLDDFPKEMVETWNVGNEWKEDDPF
ncbi:MAG: ATP-dependent helicase [Verrucomicrobia bacterium]|jgi:DNA helicase-2/ATP-dependent DNA helicase PcrA|nr:ATP-dependent helicase [Verrucomicrobiota bacterium]|tara:strand:+ start:8463 stop:10502 length:2040 start_codon:yes stop_codon:yes gene_type:complete